MPMITLPSRLQFGNTFISELPGERGAMQAGSRTVVNACYSLVQPSSTARPELIAVNRDLALSLGFDQALQGSVGFAQVMSGNALFQGMQPYSMCYGGHQFGRWAGQLGDGRAISLGELPWQDGKHATLQLKGAGPTPYSRFADGRAVLRSSIREYLCSEAMYHLGIRTTRALSLTLTGDGVERDVMYSGDAQIEPGAVVCRVSESFIRFGCFELFASRRDMDTLKALLGYCIRQYFSDLLPLFEKNPSEAALAMFARVVSSSCALVVDWMRVGFVHGVLNTDNMSIIGETIDYGPYGWLDSYAPEWTPNTTDRQHGRYRYAQQPEVVQWNLLQLANALYPLIGEAAPLEAAVRDFERQYHLAWCTMMANKLGLDSEVAEHAALIDRVGPMLESAELDMTLFYSELTHWDCDVESQSVLFERIQRYSYSSWADEQHKLVDLWLHDYSAARVAQRALQQKAEIFARMRKANPEIIPRNFIVQGVIEAAEGGDYQPLHDLVAALTTPYARSETTKAYRLMRPDWALNKVGCSMLSCSS